MVDMPRRKGGQVCVDLLRLEESVFYLVLELRSGSRGVLLLKIMKHIMIFYR